MGTFDAETLGRKISKPEAGVATKKTKNHLIIIAAPYRFDPGLPAPQREYSTRSMVMGFASCQARSCVGKVCPIPLSTGRCSKQGLQANLEGAILRIRSEQIGG